MNARYRKMAGIFFDRRKDWLLRWSSRAVGKSGSVRHSRSLLLFTITLGFVSLAGCSPSEVVSCFTPLERLAPDGAIEPTAEWGLGTQAGPYLFVSGMRGIDPATNEIVLDVEARVRQAYDNMFLIAAHAGAGPDDLVETVVYIRTGHPSEDFLTIRSYDNAARRDYYGDGPYPNRTIVGLDMLNGVDADGEPDVFEMKGTFYSACD
jgi:enamine deaminase RidA (YjgF/YER057c/UK114 family)